MGSYFEWVLTLWKSNFGTSSARIHSHMKAHPGLEKDEEHSVGLPRPAKTFRPNPLTRKPKTPSWLQPPPLLFQGRPSRSHPKNSTHHARRNNVKEAQQDLRSNPEAVAGWRRVLFESVRFYLGVPLVVAVISPWDGSSFPGLGPAGAGLL